MKVENENPAADHSANGAQLITHGDDNRNLTSNKQKKKVRKREAANAALELLAEKWPACFAIHEARRRPLKIGIHHELVAALDGAVTPTELNIALGLYTGAVGYLKKLRRGTPRIGLDGAPAGEVTAEQENQSYFDLADAAERAAARRRGVRS